MPRYKTHLSAGITISLILLATIVSYTALHLHPITALGYSSLCLFGALFPDIDTHSRIQRIALKGSMYCIAGAFFLSNHYALGILILAVLIMLSLPHRGITHRPWFIILMPLIPLLYLSVAAHYTSTHLILLYIFFTTGALSHIILDRAVSRFKRRYHRGYRKKNRS